MPALRKWYFAVNHRGLRSHWTLLRAAVVSCRRNTSLEPHCLYSGGEQPALDELRALGVTVIAHRPSLEPELKLAYGDQLRRYIGHWLRLDLPSLETEDAFVLYTDIDVMFRSMPRVIEAPSLLAAGPAEERDERTRFNSGVLVMNLPALREVWDDFLGAVRGRLLGRGFTYPEHDQASFNTFFRRQIDWLPDELNWRPYWGFSENVHIVHFHGPKPDLVQRMAMAPEGRVPPPADDAAARRRMELLRRIWLRDRAAYETFVAEYREHLRGPAEPAGPRHAVRVDDRPRPTPPMHPGPVGRARIQTRRLLRYLQRR